MQDWSANCHCTLMGQVWPAISITMWQRMWMHKPVHAWNYFTCSLDIKQLKNKWSMCCLRPLLMDLCNSVAMNYIRNNGCRSARCEKIIRASLVVWPLTWRMRALKPRPWTADWLTCVGRLVLHCYMEIKHLCVTGYIPQSYSFSFTFCVLLFVLLVPVSVFVPLCRSASVTLTLSILIYELAVVKVGGA